MPLPKPRKDESKDDFVSRCMHEAYGPNAPEDRTQEQAVAMCMQAWRDKSKKDFSVEDCPDPEDGESQEEFLDRCIEEVGGDEDQAEEACQMKWDERKASELVYKARSGHMDGMHFVLSDETVDRLGETISSAGWNLTEFRKNPIALFAHKNDFIVGRWLDLRIENSQLKGRLALAAPGTSERIDEVRKLVEAGILKAVSVGFKAHRKEPMSEKADKYFGPFRYLDHELVECSLVSVPANPNALAVAKSLNISPATINDVFTGSGRRGVVERRATGGSAKTTQFDRRAAMSLAQRISDLQEQIAAKHEELDNHLANQDDSNVSNADLEKTTRLNEDIARLEKVHEALAESEKHLAAKTKANGDAKKVQLPAVIEPKKAPSAQVQPMMVTTFGKKDLDLLDLLVRAGTVAYVARAQGKDPNDARTRYYGDDERTKFFSDLVLRTTSAPAMTTVTGWAAELVQQTWTALMPTLMPRAILTRLGAKGLTLSFGRAGKINIPTRSKTPSIAGSFVGEGQAIPVRQGAFTTQALTPKKMAVITTWTREMDEHSIPAIEGILREAIQVDTTVAVDSVLIDTNPATAIRPAGLLNSVAATTATGGGGLAALIGDLKALIGAITTATFGNLRTPVFLMNPNDIISMAMTSATNTGIFPFRDEVTNNGTIFGIPIIDSTTVTAKTVILVDAADFVVVGGEAPRLEISDQATLHMEDTAPLDLVSGSPGTVASPQRSLFQTDSLALRMVMPLNWTQRRSGTVAWTQNVTWS